MVAHFGLKKHRDIRPYSLFSNEGYFLTVSGLGKTSMAAALAYTLGLFAKTENPLVVNVGVAGHRDYPLAEVLLADKVIDADNRRSHYPPLVLNAPCKTASILTVSSPDLHYRLDHVYDMEASAFFETALNFTNSELAHSLKIISDNQLAPAICVQAKRVEDLIAGHIGTLEKLIGELLRLQQCMGREDLDLFQTVIGRWHFSVSQQNRLKQLLRNYRLLTDQAVADDFGSAKELLGWLEARVLEAGLSARLD